MGNTENPEDCPFCGIIYRDEPVTLVRRWRQQRVIAILPRHPVVGLDEQGRPGHVLVIPFEHTRHAGTNVAAAARVMTCAAELAGEMGASNIMTSLESEATQTVFHLHLHVLRRRRGDGVVLPWTPGASRRKRLHLWWPNRSAA